MWCRWLGLGGGPWVDGEGEHKVGMCVWVGRRTSWSLEHRIDGVGEGKGEICRDEFWPVVEEGEGGK